MKGIHITLDAPPPPHEMQQGGSAEKQASKALAV